MRSQARFLVPALAIAACAILAACTGSGESRAADRTTLSSSRHIAATAGLGSPGNPLVLSCDQESFGPGVIVSPSRLPRQLKPGEGGLVIGPLPLINGTDQGRAGSGDHGSYYMPFVVVPGSTVTVTIGAHARGHVGIDNPHASGWGLGLITAATYHSCSNSTGFFDQGLTFRHGQTRGCVPLDVKIGHEPLVRHVTISLGAGSCARPPSASA